MQRRRRGKTCLILILPRRLLNNLPPHLLQSILASRLLLKSSAHLLLSHLGVLGVQRTHFLTTAPPSHILFTCYPLLPPPLSERARAPALCPPQSSHRLTFPTFSPRHDITGPVPFWSSSLLHPPSKAPRQFARLQRSILFSNNHQVELSENMLVV